MLHTSVRTKDTARLSQVIQLQALQSHGPNSSPASCTPICFCMLACPHLVWYNLTVLLGSQVKHQHARRLSIQNQQMWPAQLTNGQQELSHSLQNTGGAGSQTRRLVFLFLAWGWEPADAA